MTNRQILGMHWPNHPHQRDQELRQFVGDSGPITILHMQARGMYHWLRKSGPNRLIHVRIYREWWEDESPVDLARWAADALGYLWHDPLAMVSPANEQNIELRAGPDWVGWQIEPIRRQFYAKIGRWNLQFWQEIDRLIPDRKALALWSALADGHDAIPGIPDSEYMIPEIRAAMDYCDVIASHPYGKLHHDPSTLPGGSAAGWHMLRPWRKPGTGGPRDPGGMLAQFPGKPHFISETGTFTHSYAPLAGPTFRALEDIAVKAASDRVTLGVTPFIWSSDPQHRENIIEKNGLLVESLLGMHRHTTNAPVPAARQSEDAPAPPSLASGYRPYVIQRGDTLWKLAGPRWPEIHRTVPMGDVRQLPVGAVVMIPEDIDR